MLGMYPNNRSQKRELKRHGKRFVQLPDLEIGHIPVEKADDLWTENVTVLG